MRLFRLRRTRLTVGILVAIFAGLAAWTFWWEPSTLTVVHQTIAIHPWHPEHAGLKVAVISDLHVGSPFRDVGKLKQLVTATNSEAPDLVVLLGDFVILGVIGGTLVDPESIGDQLAGLQAPLGIVAVLGNHDWWFDGNRVRHALESRGVRVLENESIRLTQHGKSFWLAGLADLLTRGNGVPVTLAQINDDEPIIVLTHNPDVFVSVPERVSLTLAGHTHGGQVRLPLIGRPVVPSKYGQRYAYGLIDEGGRKLFVTGGVGTSILPVRFGVPPEIVILRLIAAGS